MSTLATRRVEEGGGPWVVWLHGFLGSSLDLLPFAKELAPRFRSLLVDLPAHGDSALVEPKDIPDTVDLVAEAMTSAGIERAVLAGYSLGGRVALAFAARRPSRTSGLVLESASPGIVGDTARAKRIVADERRARALVEENREAFLAAWYRQSVFRSLVARSADLEVMIASRRIADPSAMARALVNFSPGRQAPTWSILPGLTCPILGIAGELDGKYLAVCRRIREAAHGATIATIPHSGHITHFEAPEAYFASIQSFLGVLEQQSQGG